MPGSAGELLGVGRRLSSSLPRIRCPLLRLRSSPARLLHALVARLPHDLVARLLHALLSDIRMLRAARSYSDSLCARSGPPRVTWYPVDSCAPGSSRDTRGSPPCPRYETNLSSAAIACNSSSWLARWLCSKLLPSALSLAGTQLDIRGEAHDASHKPAFATSTLPLARDCCTRPVDSHAAALARTRHPWRGTRCIPQARVRHDVVHSPAGPRLLYSSG